MPENSKKKNNIKMIAVIASLVVIAIGSGIAVAIFNNRDLLNAPTETTLDTSLTTTSEVINETPETQEAYTGDTFTYNGKTYRYNDDIRTILFLGIDTYEGYESDQLIGNGGRADTIMLFVINRATETINVLEINRDTYTTVDVYDDARNLIYSGDMQLSMQYEFSDNPRRGCLLMKNKITDLLYGIPVDYYCSLNIDGMTQVINALGGLEVTFDADYTYINPLFIEGATVNLTAEQAEQFYRYRDTNELGSNEGRMSRQSFLMYQVFDSMTSSSDEDIDELYNATSDSLTTDMSLEVIRNLRHYDLEEIYMTPGHYEAGVHDEFYFDEEELQDLLISIFYVEVV